MKITVLILISLLTSCAAPKEQEIVIPEKPVAWQFKNLPAPPTVATQGAQPDGGIAWDPNPPEEQILEYRIYERKGGSPPKLVGTTQTTQFYPKKKGTFFVVGVNETGEGPPSEEIKL